MDREWADLPGHEDFYRVSNDGVVWSKIRGRVLKPRATKSGHLITHLSRPDRRVMVHVAVLEAFVGPRPEGQVARHLNGVPDDNVLGNLKWGTVSENTMDAVRHGVHAQAAKTHCVKRHEYSPDNTNIQADGSRRCAICEAASKARTRRRGVPDGDPRHGSLNGYGRGCRCGDCKQANSTYQRAYRVRRFGQKEGT